MKDLTISKIERQNVLNNRFAIDKIQERLGFETIYYNEQFWLTKKMVADFYEVEDRTIERCRRRGNSPWITPALLTKYLSTTEHEERQVADSMHLCPQPLYL